MPLYDEIGQGYAHRRRPDPRIAARLEAALESARTVLNVGAGTGAYEPRGRTVLAVEPSEVMIGQRPRELAPAILGRAESLPFVTGAFDAALAVLTVHHWSDPGRGLAELRRVATGPVVVLTCDTEVANRGWLASRYAPEIAAWDAAHFPSPQRIAAWLGGATVEAVPVPADCTDGFLMSFWSHPEAVLDPAARAATSGFARLSEAEQERIARALREDLDSGAWDSEFGHLRSLPAYDAGLRLVVAHPPPPRSQGGVRSGSALPSTPPLGRRGRHAMSPATTLREDLDRWRERYAATPARDAPFTTLSGEVIRPLYTEDDLPEPEEIGLPGEYPFTRGVYPSMYRGRLWTLRQFAGFGTPEETNERFRYLLDHGQTGLSTAFDMPSLMGHDSDHPRSEGEVGREGVAVDTVDDMETLFQGIDVGEVSVSMTINAPAAIMMAYYVVAAEAKGVPAHRLGGTIQADILKEYIAQKEWCFPVDPAMRLLGDMVEWCSTQMPRWHPVSISGYHIREAGSTAAQELAFTLKDGLTYVEQAVARGLDVDSFAPRLSFFFNAQIDFFEEIAKYRAARRIWARELRDTFGAQDPKSWLMRFHTQTAGVSLTAQQPLNNITRTAIEALAGVLGGTQSLHTNSYDEALALPSEEAVRIAVRTQQVIAHETGVTNTIDPLGGSYFVEALTDEMERQAYGYFAKIDELGGMVEAVKANYPQREIADAAFQLQAEYDSHQRILVGVNDFTEGGDGEIATWRMDPALERKQIDRVQAVKAARDGRAVEATLTALRAAATTDANLMPPLLDAARAHATEGEIVHALQDVWGTYTEVPVF